MSEWAGLVVFCVVGVVLILASGLGLVRLGRDQREESDRDE